MSDPEVVDGLPVLAEPAPVAPAPERSSAAVGAQAAALAGGSLLAGATLVALVRGLARLRGRGGRRRGMLRLGGGRRRGRLQVVGSRSFLVDVHVVERR